MPPQAEVMAVGGGGGASWWAEWECEQNLHLQYRTRRSPPAPDYLSAR